MQKIMSATGDNNISLCYDYAASFQYIKVGNRKLDFARLINLTNPG